jgi:hypothetical protein
MLFVRAPNPRYWHEEFAKQWIKNLMQRLYMVSGRLPRLLCNHYPIHIFPNTTLKIRLMSAFSLTFVCDWPADR